MIDQRTLASRRFIQAHFHDLDFTCFPTHFTGVEAINKPFMFDMEMRVPNGYVDRESLMGQSVDVRLGKDKASRVFNGLVFKCSQHDSYRNSSYRDYDHYRITLVPWLYYLGLTNNCRIFQNKSPLEIFKEICRSYGYLSIDTGMLTKRYDPIAYCTQYNESDADFIDRLFQKYGISYVFTHEAGQHTMFLFDYIGACPIVNPLNLLPGIRYDVHFPSI